MPIAFITGATSGFGKACAIKFASNGYSLILNGRRKERLESLQQELQDTYKISVLILPFDVRERATVFASINNLPQEWKKIDVLVNNAGLALGRDYFHEANVDDWDTMVDTNVKGFAYVAKAVAELMVPNRQGHIINLGSIAGIYAYEKGNMYCGTKAAVAALSHAMRIDLVKHRIKVTNVQPGAAETEFSNVRFKGDQNTADQVYQGIVALSADDVADIIYYAASLPSHVCINELTVTCLQQADSFYVDREK